MSIHKINDHVLVVPEGFDVRRGGMFDALVYRGVEISTFDEGSKVDKGGIYAGPFACECNEGSLVVLWSLGEIRKFIDMMKGE